MTSPQLENGYTRIANEIMEALAGIRISGEARQVLDVILRKTYGYQKKEDIIALSQFCLITKISKTHVCLALNKLAIMNLIITKKGNGLGNIYKFNKDYSSWKALPKKVTITKKGNGHYQKREYSLPIMGHTKEKKENTTKETSGSSPPTKDSFLKGNDWKELIDSFSEVNPMYLEFYKNKTERAALDDIAKTIGKEKLKNTILALSGIISQPYAPRITKPSELKRDFGKLITFYNQQKNITNNKKETKIAFS